jgi:ribosome-binding factor A
MKPYKRSQRIGPLLLEVISEIFREEINDPRLRDIWVLKVEVSDDLKWATVYYSFLRDKEDREIREALDRAKGYIRRKISKKVFIREIPQIKFRKVKEEEKDGWLH